MRESSYRGLRFHHRARCLPCGGFQIARIDNNQHLPGGHREPFGILDARHHAALRAIDPRTGGLHPRPGEFERRMMQQRFSHRVLDCRNRLSQSDRGKGQEKWLQMHSFQIGDMPRVSLY